MENLVRVTSHLDWSHRMGARLARFETDASTDRTGTEAEPAEDIVAPTWWPQLVPTQAAKPYLLTESGELWRAYAYRDGRIARHRLPTETLHSAARLFGRFSAYTSDIGEGLADAVPGFHDIDRVWSDFEAICDNPEVPASLALVEPHIDDLLRLREALYRRCQADGLQAARHRVVHNDTKLTNVLLHPTERRAIAVLDLDLATMGPLWHDVGDLVRSAAWNRGDSSPVHVVTDVAELLRAFLTGAGDTVEPAEVVTFAVAGARIGFELGVRYLSDQLRGEPVLRVEGPNGHLARGLANMNLATEMLNAYDALRSEVDELAAGR